MTMQTATTDRLDSSLTPIGMLKAQWRIINALMLHDIRSRMGGNPFGFLLMGVVWPLTHILALLLINSGLGRLPPYGDSSAIWYATGVVPFMAFQYMSRFICMGIFSNKPLMSFPVVKVTDIIFARAIIETLNTGVVILIVFAIFWAFGIDFMPRDTVQASFAMLTMILLGLGFGIFNAVIAAAIPLWVTVYSLMAIPFWLTSGIIFLPDALPAVARGPLSYLPWLQGTEWMRSAYYDGLGDGILDKTYLMTFAIISISLGLGLERLIRGKLR